MFKFFNLLKLFVLIIVSLSLSGLVSAQLVNFTNETVSNSTPKVGDTVTFRINVTANNTIKQYNFNYYNSTEWVNTTNILLYLANISDFMKVYYTMDDIDITGTVVDDLSSSDGGANDHNGTNTGATTGVNGILNEAIYVSGDGNYNSGVGDYVDITNIANIADDAEGTVCIWFNTTFQGGTYGTLWSISRSVGLNYMYLVVRGDPTYYSHLFLDMGSDQNHKWIYNTTSLDWFDGKWHHVCLATDRIWIDGNNITPEYFEGGPGDGFWFNDNGGALLDRFTIGALRYDSKATSYAFNGSLDEFAYWDRQLTDVEVEFLFSNGAPLINPRETVSNLTLVHEKNLTTVGLFNYSWWVEDAWVRSDYYSIIVSSLFNNMTFANNTVNNSIPFIGVDVEINITIADLDNVSEYGFQIYNITWINVSGSNVTVSPSEPSIVATTVYNMDGNLTYRWWGKDVLNNIQYSDNYTLIVADKDIYISQLFAGPLYPYYNDELFCNFTPQGGGGVGNVNASVIWFKNSILVNTYDYNFTNVVLATNYQTSAGQGSVTETLIVGDIWNCNISLISESLFVNNESNNITILEARPTVITNIVPSNNSAVSFVSTIISWIENNESGRTFGIPNTPYNNTIVLNNESNQYILNDSIPNGTLSYVWDTSQYGIGIYNLTFYSCSVHGCGENVSITNITINSVPIVSPFILPSILYNNDTLRGWSNVTDANGHNQNYTFIWYKDNITYSNGTNNLNIYSSVNIANLTSGNLTVYDNWIFSVRSTDGLDYSDWVNSSVNQVVNRLLRNLTVYLPINETISRFYINATWNVIDEDEGINCSLNFNETNFYYSPLSGINYTANPSYPTSEGTYSWNISCVAEGDTTSIISENRLFTYEITPPSFSIYQTDATVYFPQIGDSFNMNVSVFDLNNVSFCKLSMNDTGAWENKTTYSVSAINSTVEMSYVIQTYSTTNLSEVSWSVWCNDTVGNEGISIIQNFTVQDITLPAINIGASNFVNGSVISNYLYNATYDITWFDYNLFQAMVNVSCELNDSIYYWEELNFNVTTYNKIDLINLSGFPLQKCILYSSASDDHTQKEWKLPKKEKKLKKGFEFDTPEKNKITIKSKEVRGNIRNMITDEKVDRKTFMFEFNDAKKVRTFEIITDHKIYYRESSGYPAHFVIWNEETHSGTWVDFDTKDEKTTKIKSSKVKERNKKKHDKYKVSKVTDYHYEVEITDDVPIRNIEFQSLGGTNIENKSWEFYIGGVINVSGINIYDNTTIENFCYNVTSVNSIPGFNVSGCINSSLVYVNKTMISGLSNGTYDIAYRKDGEFFNQTVFNYNVTESIQSSEYSSFQSIVNIYFTNVKTGLVVLDAMVMITNNDSNFNNTGYTDSYGKVIYYINASDYIVSANGTDLIDYSNSFVISLLENLTLNYVFYYYANFTLWDESTLGAFDTTSAETITLIIECVDRTSQHSINTTNPVIPIDCDYKTFKFVLDYGNLLGNYYRTYILDADDEDIYLLNLNTTDAIYNNFRIDDLMNEYDNPRIYITKTINTTEEIITSAYVDIEDKIGAYLMLNHQYHVKVVSDNQPDFIVGDYSADSVGDKIIRLYDVGIYPGSSTVNYGNDIRVTTFYNTTSDIIFFVFNDTRNYTTSVTYTIYEGASSDGVILLTSTTDISSDGVHSAEVSGLDKANVTVVMAYSSIRRDGTVHSAARIINSVTELALDFVQYFGDNEEERFKWLNLFFIIGLGVLLIMSVFSNANFTSLLVVAFAALLKMFGLIRFSSATPDVVGWSIISLTAFLSLVAMLAEGSKK